MQPMAAAQQQLSAARPYIGFVDASDRAEGAVDAGRGDEASAQAAMEESMEARERARRGASHVRVVR